jgi:uncharacterized protein YndB with AHSA1/START domain
MKRYRASIHIDTPPKTVWHTLTDAASYPQWDLTMNHIEGSFQLGQRVKFLTKLSNQAFPVTVTEFVPEQRMVLTGGLPLGLFKSQRTHALNATADGGTDFVTEEVFSGLLLPIFGKNIPDLTDNFRGFVAALKARAEATLH